MDIVLRKALRKYNGLRQQLDNVLLGDDGDTWETELKKFLAKRPCWLNGQIVGQTISPPLPPLLKTVETDIEGWLSKTEEFSKKYLGVTIHLRERFAIPTELPWKSVIPVFDPGGLTAKLSKKL